MAATLSTLQVRIMQVLMDATQVIWKPSVLQEGLRLALFEYSAVFPLGMEAVITLPGAGREIALNTLTGLLAVSDVYWPYSSTASEEWPPKRVTGWRVWWDDANPVLTFDKILGDQPQLDDEVRIWYTVAHSIMGLDGGDRTTVPELHEALMVMGGCGYALTSRFIDQNDVAAPTKEGAPNLNSLGQRYLREFRHLLGHAGRRGQASGATFGGGWTLDSQEGRNG